MAWRVDDVTLERFRARAAAEPLTYPEIGRSLEELPAGYRHGCDSITLGTGGGAFTAGTEGLRQWVCHAAMGIRVAPPAAPLTVDTTVALAVPFGGLRILAGCRVVRVVDEPDRFGFAYGTLRGHPEIGEEAFVVTRDRDLVTFTVTVFWRPGDPIVRLGGPITRRTQHRATLTYLRALAAHVQRSAS